MSATLSESRFADNPDAIFRELAAPFPADEVQFKPQVVKGNRALAIAYIDARAVMDRLDAVVGVHNWQDRYLLLPDNSVQCRLRFVHGEWIAKADVVALGPAGRRGPAESGVLGRPEALPSSSGSAVTSTACRRPGPTTIRPNASSLAAAPTRVGHATPGPVSQRQRQKAPRGRDGTHRRLLEADASSPQGSIKVGALLGHVSQAGTRAGYGTDMSQWSGPAIELAVAETKAFKAGLVGKLATAGR